MNSSNKININHSSLMGLKAELLKRQAEIDAAKAKSNGTEPELLLKPKSKKSQEKQEKPKKLDLHEVIDIDDLKVHTKSKLMLEAKSRLYDNLKKTHKNVNPNYLVDFANKSDSEEDVKVTVKKEFPDSDSDFDEDEDDWVEYVDCFGRTRKCLKEDLPSMKEKDKLLSEKISAVPGFQEQDDQPKSPRQQELEKLHEKWAIQAENLAFKSDIHYQDVLFDEARSHGVGYYAFSQDEEERKKQQETLFNMRKQTEKKQKQAQEAREKKLLMERNRLRAAKVRQKIRAGLSGELTEEEIAEIDAKYNLTENNDKKNTESVEEVKTDEGKENEKEQAETNKNSLESIEDKINAFGELLGKRNRWYTMSQEEWVEKKRKERDQEFAPVYDNFVKSSTSADDLKKDESDEEEVIGPLPPQECLKPSESSEKESENIEKKSIKEAGLKTGDEILAGLRYLRAKYEQENQ